MLAYADTSFLVKLYVHEEQSTEARDVAERLAESIRVSWIAVVELRNAIGLLQFRGALDRSQSDAVNDRVDGHLRGGFLEPVSISLQALIEEAGKLSRTLTPTMGLRAMDVLHLCAASLMEADVILTFDKRMARGARHLSLQVSP